MRTNSLHHQHWPFDGLSLPFVRLLKFWLWFLVGVCLTALTGRCLAAVMVTPHPERPGRAIPEDFLGLSVDTQSILPNASGILRYRPDNQSLIALFKTIGLRSLRVGGNTVDDAKYPVADDATVDRLFQFANAAGVTVVYSYRLKGVTDFTYAARQSKYIQNHYPNQLAAVAIGNEPDFYPKATYERYFAGWEKAAATIHDSDRSVKLGGPDTARPGQWAMRFSSDLRSSPLPIAFISQHYYFGGNSATMKDVAAARSFLLSDAILARYQKEYEKWVPSVLNDGRAYRFDETNSCSRGGKAGVSDTMASALWVLSYLHWWAAHDCAGINLHSGDRNGAGLAYKFSSMYALFWESDHGYAAKPIAYGAKAFAESSGGRIIPVDTNDPQLRAYAVVKADNTLCVTLINPTITEIAVAIPAGEYKTVSLSLLTSSNHDASDTTGVTFAGGAIGEDGSYTSSPKTITPDAHLITFTVPPASAAVAELLPR